MLREKALGPQLLDAYLNESKTTVTWETQAVMIRALGLIDHKDALPVVDALCTANKTYDEITRAAATTFVRLKRLDLTDATAVIDRQGTSQYAVTMGVLDALGYDRMMPPDDQIQTIISLVDEKPLDHPRGTSDLHYGLAAGWLQSLTYCFLIDCLMANDTPLTYVAENALKGKYVKLR